MPGDFEQSLAEEEHHPGIIRRAELPVDGQAQDVAVEAAAAVQVAGAQEDPAAQNVYATISASRGVTRGLRRTRTVPPFCTGTVPSVRSFEGAQNGMICAARCGGHVISGQPSAIASAWGGFAVNGRHCAQPA